VIKVNEESTVNEDDRVVCNYKEVAPEVSNLMIKEVELHIAHKAQVEIIAEALEEQNGAKVKFDVNVEAKVEKSGMKEVKNLEDVKKVEKGLPLSREVKGIEDLIMKTKEESRHASWDPGEIVDAEAQMFNMKVEVMPNGDVNAKALFDAMSLFNFVRLYTFEVLVLVARNAVRFVDVNPLSSRSFAESFPPILSDYG